jgi:WD40 repeat protein
LLLTNVFSECLAVLSGYNGGLTTVRFHEDFIATGSNDGYIRLYSVEDYALRSSIKTIDENVVNLDLQGHYIAASGMNESMRIWDANSGQLLHERSHAGSTIWHVKFYLEDGKAEKRNTQNLKVIWPSYQDSGPTLKVDFFQKNLKPKR